MSRSVSSPISACEVDHSERHTFPGHLRLHVRDPHGNRVELLVPTLTPGDA